MKRIALVLITALTLAAVPFAASADSPFRGNSGNFSSASCPSPNNPHCPPQGK